LYPGGFDEKLQKTVELNPAIKIEMKINLIGARLLNVKIIRLEDNNRKITLQKQ
jgi:hypothetical protein